MATLVLGGLGALIGSSFGGPAGARLGWSIGTTLGGVIDSLNQPNISTSTGKLSDLRFSGSNYGAMIPRVWGKFRVPGNIMWVAEDANGNHLIEHSRTTSSGGGGSGGGGKVEQTTYWYTASYAVEICEGTFMDIDGNFVTRNVVLKKIWADDLLIYDSSNPAANTADVTFYSGSESQTVDPLIESVEGVDMAPAYRGIAYVVITDHDLSKFSNRIPNLSFEIWTDDVTYANIFSDIVKLMGLRAGDMDVTGAGTPVRGFIQRDRATGQDLINSLTAGYPYDVIEVDGKLVPLIRGGAVTATLNLDELGITSGERVPKMERTIDHEEELPGRIDVTYFDSAADYQQVTQGEVRHSADIYNALSLNLPLVLTKDEARQIGARHLDTRWTEKSKYDLQLGLKYIFLSPGDCLLIPDGSTTQRLRILELDLGDPGMIKIISVLDDDQTSTQYVGGGTGGSGGGTGLEPVPTDFRVWSGTELRSQDQISAGFYAVGNGGPGWSGAAVYYSADSEVTWVYAGILTSRGTFGVTDNDLADGTAGWDYTNTLQVVMDYGTLETVSQSQVEGGENILVVEDEILGFMTATLTGPGEYDLDDLLRGIRDSVMTHTSPPDQVVMANAAVCRVQVPDTYAGNTLHVRCVSPGETLADVTSRTVVIAAKTPSDNDLIKAVLVYPVFLASAVNVVSGQTTTSSWATYDASGDVPSEATHVILEASGALNSPDSGTLDGILQVRKASGSITLEALRVRAAGAQDNVAGNNQLICELTTAWEFDWQVQTVAFNEGVDLRIVGYWRTIG